MTHPNQIHSFTDEEADNIMALADAAFAPYGQKWHEAKRRYHAGEMSDETFLQIRTAYFAAQEKWDTLFRLFNNNG